MKKNDQRPQEQEQQQHHHHQLSASKILINSKGFLQNLVFYSFLIGFGFGLGVILSFHMNSVNLFRFSRFSSPAGDISSSGSISSPPVKSPLPPSPPPQTSLEKCISAAVTANASHRNKHTRVGIRDFWEPREVMHNMTEDELLWRASLVAKRTGDLPLNPTPKIAFMFLTRGDLPLRPLWERFFKGHKGLFSIYVHTSDVSYVDDTAGKSPFYRRRIPSKEVDWGQVNMVEAERRLIANALLDFSNQRFVLLSESDIPLFNFTSVYTYLLNSTHTFVDLFDEPGPRGRGRYHHRMWPEIAKSQWRKGSQWFVIDRDLALEVVADTTYFPVFKKYCKFGCYADEHYLPTLVHIKFSGKNANRTLMWTDWSRRGPHPRKYVRQLVTAEFLNRLRNNREAEECEYNGMKTEMCFLFARKFGPDSLNRLLFFAPEVLHF